MPTIVSYRKFIDATVTREIKLPEDPATRARVGNELATIEGVTYCYLPDGATLPTDQPAEIAASVQAVTLTDALRESIKAASPHVRLIAARTQEKIRAAYPLEEELYLARIAVGALRGTYTLQTSESAQLGAYQTFVESVREWGRAERAKLGL